MGEQRQHEPQTEEVAETETVSIEPPVEDRALTRRHRVTAWVRCHQLALAVPLALAIGLAVGGTAIGGTASGGPAGADGHDHGASSEGEQTIWTCSMHPQIKLPDPGPCPICGMDLIPLDVTEGAGASSPTEVVLSEHAKVLARIETAPARRADTSVELRLLGRLEVDETTVHTITPWVDGRIDRLLVSTIGERIKRGQTIASIYSPEVYAATADLIQAERQLGKLKKALPIAREAAKAALESSRNRLRLLGMSPNKIGKGRKGGKARSIPRNVGISSSYAGTVIEQLVHEGAYVKAGTPLFKTADLTTLWAQLDAYESHLSRVTKGQKVTLEISSFPGETFTGTVAFVDPVVDGRTRTAQIRVEVPNADGRLSPGMFADAVIHAADQAAVEPPIVIPHTAPLFTGKRSVIFVALAGKEKPTYQAREVRLGPRAGDTYPVLSGLKEGEQVVVRGAFALDADLQIRGGQSMMTLADDQAREARSPVAIDDKFQAGFAPVLAAYLKVHSCLAADDLEGAEEAFAELAERTAAFTPKAPAKASDVWKGLARSIAARARQASQAADLAAARLNFEAVSLRMIEALQRFGNPGEAPLRLAFCPMAFDNQGALWLQLADEIENPYFGAEMHRCGERRHTLTTGQRLGPHAAELSPSKPPPAPAGHQH